ncbi:MAG: dTDP-4-dehydrorhamnose 3,5-epimerase [Burkholderiales bacterium]|nr:dTDP-4-dehydrorhamnose 3,5-epimerase [Pseudomonadota bacterium]MCC7069269.1 dTDP-4-dehydrorhamnose 3,5-epimerase [Burkholderiales bacterium]
MKVVRTKLSGVLVLEPQVFADERGYFMETFNAEKFRNATGAIVQFVQDNQSFSKARVLRGLHYQIEQAQGKLVRVASGAVFDVVVDLRRSSPTFAQWDAVDLSAENQRMLWVPPGCAHGFVVTADHALFLYKVTDAYAPRHERTIAWNDPSLGIRWPIADPIVNDKDAAGLSLRDAPTYA